MLILKIAFLLHQGRYAELLKIENQFEKLFSIQIRYLKYLKFLQVQRFTIWKHKQKFH